MYDLLKICLESGLFLGKLVELEFHMKQKKDLEYVICLNGDKPSANTSHIVEQAFDCFIVRSFFTYLIKFFKTNFNAEKINGKPMLLIKYIITNSEWSEDNLLGLVARAESEHCDNSEEILTNQQWSCQNCTFLNDIDARDCVMCANPKKFLNNETNSIFYS